MAANALVQTRIDSEVRDRASAVLESMGLTVSDAVRVLRMPLPKRHTYSSRPAWRAGMARLIANRVIRRQSVGRWLVPFQELWLAVFFVSSRGPNGEAASSMSQSMKELTSAVSRFASGQMQ